MEVNSGLHSDPNFATASHVTLDMSFSVSSLSFLACATGTVIPGTVRDKAARLLSGLSEGECI